MKKWVSSILIAVSFVFLSAVPANAVSIENTQTWYGSQKKCYYNYNWFETYILGRQDTWKYGNQWC